MGFGSSRSRSRSRPATARQGSDEAQELSSSDIQKWNGSQANRGNLTVVTTTVDAMPPPSPFGRFQQRSPSKGGKKSMDVVRQSSRKGDIRVAHTHTTTTSSADTRANRGRPAVSQQSSPSERLSRPRRRSTETAAIGMALGNPRMDPLVLAPQIAPGSPDADTGTSRRSNRSTKDSQGSTRTAWPPTNHDLNKILDGWEREPRPRRWRTLFARKTSTPAASPRPSTAKSYCAQDPSPIFDYDQPSLTDNGGRLPTPPPESPPEAKPRPSLFMTRSRATSRASEATGREASPGRKPKRNLTKLSRSTSGKLRKRAPVPKPTQMDVEQMPDLECWLPPQLDVEIPNTQMERYSVMFSGVLNPKDPRSSLLVRRQANVGNVGNVEKLGQLEGLAAIAEINTPRRLAGSPPATGKESPTFSLYPAAAGLSSAMSSDPPAETVHSRSLVGPSPLGISEPAVASLASTIVPTPSASQRPPALSDTDAAPSQLTDSAYAQAHNSLTSPMQASPANIPSFTDKSRDKTPSCNGRKPSPSPSRRLSTYPPRARSSASFSSTRAGSAGRRVSPSPTRRNTAFPSAQNLAASRYSPPPTSPPHIALPEPPLSTPTSRHTSPSPRPQSRPRTSPSQSADHVYLDSAPNPLRISPPRPVRPPRHLRPDPDDSHPTPVFIGRDPSSHQQDRHHRQPAQQERAPPPARQQSPPKQQACPQPEHTHHYERQPQHPHSIQSQDPTHHSQQASRFPDLPHSAPEFSIARQISVSQRQRAALRLNITGPAAPPSPPDQSTDTSVPTHTISNLPTEHLPTSHTTSANTARSPTPASTTTTTTTSPSSNSSSSSSNSSNSSNSIGSIGSIAPNTTTSTSPSNHARIPPARPGAMHITRDQREKRTPALVEFGGGGVLAVGGRREGGRRERETTVPTERDSPTGNAARDKSVYTTDKSVYTTDKSVYATGTGLGVYTTANGVHRTDDNGRKPGLETIQRLHQREEMDRQSRESERAGEREMYRERENRRIREVRMELEREVG